MLGARCLATPNSAMQETAVVGAWKIRDWGWVVKVKAWFPLTLTGYWGGKSKQ
jgi:hypothetical protein